MKRATFSVLFYTKKSKMSAKGLIPVYVRVTINGVRCEATLNFKIKPDVWSAETGRCIGRDRYSQEVNHKLEMVKVKLMEIQRQMELDDYEPTASDIIDAYFGRSKEEQVTLMRLFKEHNDKCKELMGREIAKETVKRYNTSYNHTLAFLRHQYNANDIDVRKIDHEFIENYEFYLKSVRNCNHNSTMKYIKNFGKIVRIAKKRKLIKENPFEDYIIRLEKVEVVFLEESEIKKIAKKDFGNRRLSQVRDVFMFCCFTGLAYIDAKNLSGEHIFKDTDGLKWIRKTRQKTKNMCNIPLLTPALEILERYSSQVEERGGLLLPISCNQKMNGYLKEIGEICGIEKALSTHVARHTFATTICLGNGVSIENIAKMLGHSDVKMTKHYAQVMDKTIVKDMQKVKKALFTIAS